MPNTTGRFRTVVVGCRMGGHHAAVISRLTDFELIAVCDLNRDLAAEVAANTGNPMVFTDYKTMLEQTSPDVVVIATPTSTHAELTCQAAESGVHAVYCEKPMAVSLGEALQMMRTCAAHDTVLVIGHQRRMSQPYRAMRHLIEKGALGDVYLVRGSCAGDFLSDGTHLVDSALFLMGDPDVKWVSGTVTRREPDPPEVAAKNRWAYTGSRYGHLVESGAIGVFETADGVRAELFTGELALKGRRYQDIEIYGTKGRVWRPGDDADPPVLFADMSGGGWVPVEIPPNEGKGDFDQVFEALAESIRHGVVHPMDARVAIKGFEVVMSVYESARVRKVIVPPLTQMAFPLDLMFGS